MWNLKEFIMNNLERNSDNKRLFEKYEWLKNYYNDTVRTRFVPEQCQNYMI